MGKSSKKSATKIDAAPAVVAPAKSGKKGKRQAEEEIPKPTVTKKQKTNEALEQAVQKQKIEAKTQKKKKVETSSSSEEESDSEEEKKVIQKQKVEVKTQKKKKEETSSSEEDSDSEEEEKPAAKAVLPSKKEPLAAKNGTIAAPAKKSKPASSSEEESSDEDSSEDEAPKSKIVATKNGPSLASKKKASRSSSESEESSDEENVSVKPTSKANTVPETADKKGSAAVSKKDSSDSDTSSDEEDGSSDEEPEAPAKTLPKVPDAIAKKKADSSGSGESDSDEDESDSDDDTTGKGAVPAAAKTQQAKQPQKKMDVDNDESEDDDDESEDGSSDESDEEPKTQPQKKSKVDADVEMVDAATPKIYSKKEAPKAPATPQGQNSSKTLFVGNLSFSVERSDVENFFKDAGTVVDVRFASDPDGRFKGFGHVDFDTAEAAQKALELNGQMLLNREIRLDLARERGAYTPTPHGGKDSGSFQKGGRGESQTVFVRGFDKSLGEDEVRSALQDHFANCGEVTRVSIPKDYDTGAVKGIAYLDFKDGDSFSKALELNGTECGDGYLTVEEAKPRGDSRDGGGRSGGRGDGGRYGGRSSRGRGSGRSSDGGRFSSRGGRFSGGRGRGPNKPSYASSGKKTTFNDDE